jgi:hypothetical protein
MRDNFNNQFATLRLLDEDASFEEQSMTGGGEAYLPGLDVPEKKYKGLEEDEGPLYSDYDEFVNPFYIVIKLNDGRILKISKKKIKGGQKMYNAILDALNSDKYHVINAIIKAILKSGNLGEDKYSGYKELKGFKPGHTPDRGGFQYKQMWENEGDEDYEVGDEVKIILKGNPEFGKSATISGVSPKGNFYTVTLKDGKQFIYHESDLERSGSEEVEDDENDELNENYSRFKKETVMRSKSQQMHEATKLIEKKLKEVNKLLEYACQMKQELSEGDDQFSYNHHTSKVMERITAKIAEAYTKSKKLK